MTAAPKVILVADDNPRAAIRLAAAGHAVTIASDGPAALAMAVAAPPAVVVAPCQMRGLSGLELCHRLRLVPATAAVSVILLTDVGYALSPAVAARVGVSRALGRPAGSRLLLAALADVLAGTGSRAA